MQTGESRKGVRSVVSRYLGKSWNTCEQALFSKESRVSSVGVEVQAL